MIRKYLIPGCLATAVLFFVYSTSRPNSMWQQPPPAAAAPCKVDTIIVAVAPTPPPENETLNSSNSVPLKEVSETIFVREKFQVIQLNGNISPDASGAISSAKTIDLLLNTRKLALFAVHELNSFIFQELCGRNNSKYCTPDVAVNVSKWWTNPMNTLSLKTKTYASYRLHDLTFVAEPGIVPYFVRIRQNNIPTFGTNWTELVVDSTFARLDGEPISPPSEAVPATPPGFTIPNVKEMDEVELFSWPRNRSFIVGDYVNFSDPSLYRISSVGRKGNMSSDPVRMQPQLAYCGKALKMLVMISSAPTHFEQRRIIRETFGSEKNLKLKKVRLVFLFGVVSNSTLQKILAEEAATHDDIIQADFMDSYHNLSLSHLSMYNWVQTTCEEFGLPKYVLKADDDFLLNVELALKVAYENPEYEFIGTLFCHTAPIRDVAYMMKYYTPRYMHIPDRYAGYLSGVAYLVRTDVFPRILKMSLTTPMVHMDDAYITGMLTRQLGIWPAGSDLFTYTRSKIDTCSLKAMACSYVLNPLDMKAQWSEFEKPTPPDCNLTKTNDLIKVKPISTVMKNFCDYA